MNCASLIASTSRPIADDRIIYTNALCPAGFCPHFSKRTSPIAFHIRSPHVVVSLFVGSVVVHDARLPKLQVGPNVAKRKVGRIGATGTVDGLMKKEARALAYDSVYADIKAVMFNLRRRLETTVSL